MAAQLPGVMSTQTSRCSVGVEVTPCAGTPGSSGSEDRSGVGPAEVGAGALTAGQNTPDPAAVSVDEGRT